jgi:hypothetical protein
MAYEGVSADDYAADYHSLQSTFAASQPCPGIHMHFRTFNKDEIPIGRGGSAATASDEDRATFDTWLRARWQEKDDMLGTFYKTGSLNPSVPHTIVRPEVVDPTHWLYAGLAVLAGIGSIRLFYIVVRILYRLRI